MKGLKDLLVWSNHLSSIFSKFASFCSFYCLFFCLFLFFFAKYTYASEQVANFHMGNGAQFHRINWMGNPSLNGLRSSMGMMVNYLYDLPSLDANVSAFHAHGPPGCESGNFSQSPLLGEAVKLVLAEEK